VSHLLWRVDSSLVLQSADIANRQACDRTHHQYRSAARSRFVPEE